MGQQDIGSDPSPEEIEAAKEAISAKWSAKQRAARRVGKSNEVRVQAFHLEETAEGWRFEPL
jgi:hypothetical protein